MSGSHDPLYQDSGGSSEFNASSININDISLISVYWSDIAGKPGFCNLSLTGSYNDLIDIPSFAPVAFTGNYNQLSNIPWINSNNNIYNSNLGNVGIGTNNPIFKLHLIGNLGIQGDIIPTINSNFNLGSSNNRWKDLYLSGNSIYLDNLIISKNNSNNLEIRDTNNNLGSINAGKIILNDNNKELKLEFNNGKLIYNSNGISYESIEFSKMSDVVYNNILEKTSNNLIDYTDSRIPRNFNLNNLTTDKIEEGIQNKFIVNDKYSQSITFESNVNIKGNYQLNGSNIPFSIMKYTNAKTINGVFNYDITSNNYGYYSFLVNDKIIFTKQTICDLLIVGAGGNGGIGNYSGGGGAGEVIAYPNYSFNSGTYEIQVGKNSTNSNLRASKIFSGSNNLIIAKGGGNGISNYLFGNYIGINVNNTNDYYVEFTSNINNNGSFNLIITSHLLSQE